MSSPERTAKMIFFLGQHCSHLRVTRTSLHTVFIIVIASPLVTGGPLPDPEGWTGKDLDTPGDLDMCDPCPAGTFMEVPCLPDQPDKATCTPCPEGTYTRKENHFKSCRPHKTSCNAPYQIKEPVQPGDKTHNAVCHCEHWAFKVTNNQCVKRKQCPPGKGMTRGGRCKLCKQGTFSDKKSMFQKCRPITNCTQEGREILRPGSITSDALCGVFKSVTDFNKTHISSDDMIKDMKMLAMKKTLQNIKKEKVDASQSDTAFAEDAPTIAARSHDTDTDSFTTAMKTLLQRHTKEGDTVIQDLNRHLDLIEPGVKLVLSTENYGSHTVDAQHIKLAALQEILRTTKSPVFSETPADNTTRINLIIAITSACFLASVVIIGFLVCVIRYLKIIVKQKNLEGAPLIVGRQVEEGAMEENTGYLEEIGDTPELSQEQPCTEPSSPHADLQETPLGAEGISSRKESEMQPSKVPAAVVRPKQWSLTTQPHVHTSDEEDSLQYTGSHDDETVPLIPRGSQEISSPIMDPVFKAGGIEVVLHRTPPLKEDEDSSSKPPMTEDATEPSVAQQTLPDKPEDLPDTEDQHTEGSAHEEDGTDAGPMSEPKGLRTEKEDEEETSIKQISGSAEDTNDIPPDIEEIARTAMVRVPSDELSFPVQESTHDDSDGLEALGAVGGRSESPFSPLPSAQADSDSESSSGDEAYERKVRVAIRDSVAKSLFTGLAHHLSNPAGPGPDWVPLARAAGVTGPEIDHIINEAAQDLDKDIRKMLERYEEGKTGDRPISELYGELIARKRQELYNTFRRDPPS